jgi:DNA-binding MarR family transcriptional regulator
MSEILSLTMSPRSARLPARLIAQAQSLRFSKQTTEPGREQVPPTDPQAAGQRSHHQRSKSSASLPASRSTTDELDELTDAFLTSARALVALAVRSINAAPVEVTLMQHRVLVLLASQSEQSVSALAEQLGVNASNASRVCDRLERLGLVSRRRSTTDARSVRVALTAEGMDVLQAVNHYRRNEIRHVLSSLSTEVGRDVVEALRSFNEAADERTDTDWVVPSAT